MLPAVLIISLILLTHILHITHLRRHHARSLLTVEQTAHGNGYALGWSECNSRHQARLHLAEDRLQRARQHRLATEAALARHYQ